MLQEKINNMCEIENIKSDVEFFINEFNNKIIVKNKNDKIEIYDLMCFYFDVASVNSIQEFEYLYSFCDTEIIEFILK